MGSFSCPPAGSLPGVVCPHPPGGAGGPPAMGAAILATNAPAVAARLRDLRAVLDGWLAELEQADGPDEGSLRDRLAAARAILAERP